MDKKEMDPMSNAFSIPQEAVEALRKADTGMVNDALALMGLNGGVKGVRPARGYEDAKVVGRVATVLFGAPRPDSPRLTMYQIIRDTPAGSVMVIDGKGMDVHFTGDNQGECAKRQGLAGIVVYGGARDIAGYRAMGMPLYCMGSATVDKPAGIQVIGQNVPIEIAGVTVKPGDILVADEDGVVCIPAEALPATLEKLRIIFEVEEAMETAIASCAPVEEIKAIIARKKRS
jgi:4-hydroxy-4-methyl-2-oxoglutarate aldolase